ncbi:MAG: ABC transporter permease, partial [Lachnospiraceae bacterium]|nr:ABC transporter permease [Lachnospiraceae bacterium]
MAEDKNLQKNNAAPVSEEEYSLNDDRRVKVLSPGAMVAKRFFRNRIAVFGMSVLVLMFLFSFVGGLITPYGESQLFYRVDYQQKEYASAIENTEFRYRGSDAFTTLVQAQMLLAINKNKDSFTWMKANYKVNKISDDLYTCVNEADELVGVAYKAIFNAVEKGMEPDLETLAAALTAYENKEASFTAGGASYTMDELGNITTSDGKDYGYILSYNVQPLMGDVFLTREFKEQVVEHIESGVNEFVFTDADGVEHEYKMKFEARADKWSITQATETRVYDTYSPPSKEHWLGTDKNGMDVLTRLMYGGRVSLVIGFVVEFIATLIAIVLGGIAGYFGG